jgi:hypothetical protein
VNFSTRRVNGHVVVGLRGRETGEPLPCTAALLVEAQTGRLEAELWVPAEDEDHLLASDLVVVDPGHDAAFAETDAESGSIAVAPLLAYRAPLAEILAEPALRQAADATLGDLVGGHRSLPGPHARNLGDPSLGDLPG